MSRGSLSCDILSYHETLPARRLFPDATPNSSALRISFLLYTKLPSLSYLTIVMKNNTNRFPESHCVPITRTLNWGHCSVAGFLLSMQNGLGPIPSTPPHTHTQSHLEPEGQDRGQGLTCHPIPPCPFRFVTKVSDGTVLLFLHVFWPSLSTATTSPLKDLLSVDKQL